MIEFLNREKERNINFMYVFSCSLNILFPENNFNNFASW